MIKYILNQKIIYHIQDSFFIQNINYFWEYNHQKVLKIFILNILSIISNWTRNNGACAMEQVCHPKYSPKPTTCFPVIDPP